MSLDRPPGDVRAVVATARGRALEREGIAMVVALQDARPGRSLQVTDARSRRDGRRLVELFDHYEQGLDGVPLYPPLEVAAVEGGGPDPTGAAALIDVLVVLADQHLRAPARP